jgi:hypothetical protein
VLSRLFRRLFLEKLVAAHDAGSLQFISDHAPLAECDAFAVYLAPLRKSEWVVYSKKPFRGPEVVAAFAASGMTLTAAMLRRAALPEEPGIDAWWRERHAHDDLAVQHALLVAPGEAT